MGDPALNKEENYHHEWHKHLYRFCEDSLGSKAKEESHRKGIGDAGLLAIGGLKEGS